MIHYDVVFKSFCIKVVWGWSVNDKKARIRDVGVSMYPWVAPEGRSRQPAMHFSNYLMIFV